MPRILGVVSVVLAGAAALVFGVTAASASQLATPTAATVQAAGLDDLDGLVDVEGLTGGVVDGVGGLVDGVGRTVSGVGDTVKGVGSAVSGLGGSLSGVVGGVTGGLGL